jgi:MFS family permease
MLSLNPFSRLCVILCRVLLMGLCLWSAATALSAAAAAATSNTSLALVLLLVSRLGMGWFSACIMPCVTSILARWVAPEQRASSVSFVYANFNVGELGWGKGAIAGPSPAMEFTCHEAAGPSCAV